MSDPGYPRIVRRAPRRSLWPARLGMAAAGVAVMALEGALRPSPGIGFAVGFGLLLGAAMLGVEREK